MEPIATVAYRFCPVCGAAYAATQHNEVNKTCTVCGFVLYENQNATVGAIIVYQNKILLIRRAVEPHQGTWDIPGGFVEPNESCRQAIEREVKEETALSPKIVQELGSYGPTWYVYQGKGSYNTDFYYLMESATDQFTVGDDAATGQWFALDQLPQEDEIGFPSVRRVLQDLTAIL